MSFEDLPSTWGDEPIDDPVALADVFDLFCRDADRRRGALVALLCDEQARLLQPMVVDDVPNPCEPLEQVDLMWRLAQAVAGAGVGALALAVCRGGRLRTTLHEQGWAEALRAACEDHGLRDLGCHLATPDGIMAVQSQRPAA